MQKLNARRLLENTLTTGSRPRLALIALLLGVGLFSASPSHAAVAAGPDQAGALTVSYDCDTVPWLCEGARRNKRWQIYKIVCPASGCQWRWEQRAEDGDEYTYMNGDFVRLYFGYDNDRDEVTDIPLGFERPGGGEFYFEQTYRCTQYPQLCDGVNAWQLYSCTPQRDGSCWWEWTSTLTGNATGLYGIYPVDRYLIHWGEPRGYVPPATPTAIPSATYTPSVTPAPSVTPTPSNTPSPTDVPPPTTTQSPSATPTQTATATATSPATATPERFAIYMPKATRPQ